MVIFNWLKFVAVLTLWAMVFIPVYPGLWHSWMNNANNSHGLLVPIISAFLIWYRREELSAAPLNPSILGGFLFAISISIYLLALAGQVLVVQRVMIVSSLIGLIIFNFGKSFFKILAFPLIYLIFMVPVPVSLYSLAAFPLQLFATDISHFLIHQLGIPVLQEGNMLYFSQAKLSVAEACSGIRSITALLMIGVLFAYFMDKSWWRRVVLVFSAIPLALVANIIRVTGTGILAHFYGGQVAKCFLHEFSGLAVFTFGFVLMFFEYILLNKLRPEPMNLNVK